MGGERLAEWRARCRADGRAFLGLVRAAGLRLATDRMAYWARWITPEERPVRYDARFFVAAALPGMAPEPDGVEVVACRWTTPAAALAGHGAGALVLPFPTQQRLRSLGPYAAADALLAAAGTRAVTPVRPRVVATDGSERILLPGDPGYF